MGMKMIKIPRFRRFSALQRAEIAEMLSLLNAVLWYIVSVLFNEPKLLKSNPSTALEFLATVSVLFNEPKLLKWL